jgi:mono/diheme cytochrome c family protein
MPARNGSSLSFVACSGTELVSRADCAPSRARGGRRRGIRRLRPGGLLLLLSLAVQALGTGCHRSPEPPAVDAVQKAFRVDELSAREAHGQRVFAERCATCHGPAGRGDGQNAYNLDPAPPDFQASLNALSTADRRAVIEGGAAALGRSPLCPPWGRSLGEEEVVALLAYMEVMEKPSPEEDAAPRGRRRWRRSR